MTPSTARTGNDGGMREQLKTALPLLLFLLVVFFSPLLYDLSQRLG